MTQPFERGSSHLLPRNVGTTERYVSLLAGAAMIAAGAKRRDGLGAVSALAGGALLFRGATGHCPVYASIGVNSARTSHATVPYGEGTRVERSVTILKPLGELYAFWRDFSNLPRFMDHLHEVRIIDAKRSHWVAAAPGNNEVSWDAEIINEIPNELIAWKSVEGSDVMHAGSVHFKELGHGRGTEIRVEIEYVPPAGPLGRFVARMFGEEPSMQVASDLRRLKRILEIGEELTVEGQPSAREV